MREATKLLVEMYVIMDHEGCWIRGFAYEMGLGSIISAEFYGVLYVLKLARGKMALRRSGWRVTTV